MSNLEILIGSDRAEDLTADQVIDLFAGAGGDDEIVRRLISPGVYLLQGSRGTGKTMLLRVAYERLRRDKARTTLPVFVSFSKYLATYNSSSRKTLGYNPFQNWVFAKLLAGIRDEARRLHPAMPVPPSFGPVPLDGYTQRLEMHYQDATVADPTKNAALLGVTEQDLYNFARLDQMQSKVLSILDSYGLDSVAFFLDEAAQNFAEDLQPEFFQLIRHLRHHRISVKAAVYPNITNYGRDFDVGHDAIILPLERQIENAEGMALFRELVKKRFANTDLGRALEKSETQRDFLIKISGGNPRWLIHLLNRLNHSTPAPISNAQALVVAKELPDNTLWPYLQKLRKNLVSKRKYVDSAIQLAQNLIDGLRETNKNLKRGERPVCYVAVSTHKTVPFRVHAAIRILQYAGIASSRGPKKITGRDAAEMFLLHPAILVKESALFGAETNPPLDALVSALTDPPRERFREYTRNSPKLLEFRQDEESDGVTCASCDALVPDGAKFCMHCGNPITQSSPYEELLSQPVSELELTPGIKQRLLSDKRFPTVRSIMEATDADLDSIPFIGRSRIPLIRYAVEEFLAG
jgi:hypothetical protein